jgi:hypothetical protein
MSYGVTWTRVWTLYTPLWRDKHAPVSPPGLRKQRITAKDLQKNTAQVMSSPQPDDMNRYKANHAHPNNPERRPLMTPHPSRWRARQPGS